MLSRLNQTTKRLIIAATAFVVCVTAVAFLNYQTDDEIYFGADDYENVPEYADGTDGVITINESVEAKPGSTIATTPAIHVDKGSFVLNVDHQNEADIEVEIYDGKEVIARTSLPRNELNTSLFFTTESNVYDLEIHFMYEGKGQAVLKRSILYSLRGAFYSDTIIFAVFIVIAACALTAMMIKKDFFELPVRDKVYFASIVLYLILINYMYYRPFPLGVEDVGYHLARIEATYNEMTRGQIPIVMYSDFVQGRGMIGIMYPYLLLFIPALLRVLHMSPEGALRLFFILINCATCASAYYASRKMLKNKYLAAASMMLYGMLIYRITTMTYRYAYGELQAFVFFPLVIWGLYEVLAGDRTKWPILTLGMTGLMQCHLISFIQAAVLCVIMGMTYIFKFIKECRILQVIYAVIATVLLNLWYIVPFMTYYREDLGIYDHLSWGDNIYTFSSYITGMLRLFPNTSEGETQHKMGIVGLWLVLLTGIAVYIQLKKSEKDYMDRFALVLLITGVAAIFMASKSFPWETLLKFDIIADSLKYLQFVGRFYMIGEICLFFGTIITIAGGINPDKCIVRGIMLVIVLTAATQAYAVSDSWLSANTDPFMDIKAGRYKEGINDTTVEDYVPEGYWFGEGFADYAQSPEASITEYVHDHLHTSFRYYSGKSTYVELPILYYKGYKASGEDGTPLVLENGTAGCMRVNVPANDDITKVNVDFTGFTAWKISLLISVISAISLMVIIVRKSREYPA